MELNLFPEFFWSCNDAVIVHDKPYYFTKPPMPLLKELVLIQYYEIK